jgi:small subunit ribosomal protein S29e
LYVPAKKYTDMLRTSRANGDKKKSGIIRKYGINMSRQAFREHAEAIGFKKTR